MSEEPVPYTITDAGALALRVTELEHILRHFDRASMDLHLYVRAVDKMPTPDEWDLIRGQIQEMVDAYGPRNPNR
jgi:hypothetical protein